MNKLRQPTEEITTYLRKHLSQGTTSTQRALCQHLNGLGYEVNQSKISRLLRKLGAIKSKNEQGHIAYGLPREPAPPNKTSLLHQMIIEIRSNETSIIIQTTPGAAAVIARMLDFHRQQSQILGTIAGDDTILVIPQSNPQIKQTLQAIETLLYA
ncbi:MAG: ArgR family transcriptional regulator [Gammaproteobacteria bacterium]